MSTNMYCVLLDYYIVMISKQFTYTLLPIM